jgi:geranylgeranyl diphosphate synthase type I
MFLQIQKEVYCGQQLDLTGDDDVARMHALKTTSYSVRGPLLLGALLGNPSSEQLRALAAWAEPIGEAFQIRDDLLGALGSPDSTGKPGMDIPHGKMSSVLMELRRSTLPAERLPIETIAGRGEANQGELREARRILYDSGVIDRLERRIADLRNDALSALDRACFGPQGRGMLTELADKLTIRQA